ncbi:MAG: acyl carrier protein [Bacteroidetes bacterium]|nr:MAG: acyl carrier protein [Bacteroidota bacterium]TAE63528.1 MAG: acyl carrier protein [Bacteroidota bacterium]TAF93002.1 MAG: acyl carrier protein [Bacteroidota bacterium]
MPSEQILSQLQTIFEDVLDVEDVQITPEHSANDIEEWDSINHIQLVVAVEKHFKIRFKNEEVLKWKTVADMIASIEQRITA